MASASIPAPRSGGPGVEAPDLTPLFSPRSIAFVGATDDLTRFGGRCLKQTLGFGYRGRIYPVNPKRTEVQGMRCYPGVADLPETPDHVGIVLPAGQVMPVLQQCAARGVPFVTVFSGGFAETGSDEGRRRQQALADFVRTTPMRMMGPNCNGVISFVHGFAMTSTAAISDPRGPTGNVGVVAHSGGLGQVNVMWRAQQLGIGVSFEASCGNEADLDALDFADWMIADDATDVVLMAVEALKDGAKLARVAARAAARDKAIVMLKFGRSEAGRRAAQSHTGALAGADDVLDAALRQYGIIRVDDCDELGAMAMLLRTKRRPRGRRIASLSLSGGNVVQLADSGERLGLEWPEYDEATQGKLAALLPGYGRVANPTDLTSAATGVAGVFQQAVEALAADPNVDIVAPAYTFARRADLEHAAALAGRVDKPVIVLWTGGCTDDKAFRAEHLAAAGAAVFRDTVACLRVIGRAAWHAEWHARHADVFARTTDPAAREAVQAALAGASGNFSEAASKRVLADFGFPVTREAVAADPDAAAAIAADIGGPVAVKVSSAAIPHKTEAGAIRLGVTGDAAVRAAWRAVVDAARRHAPGAAIDGALVQEMAPPGLEMILGVARDPCFGAVIAVGLGGVLAEVLRDVTYRVPPVTSGEARCMLSELRGARLLQGVRGAPPRDIDALVDAIVRLSAFVLAAGDGIGELDVNPLLVRERGSGVLVVDAMLVVNGTEAT
jgi:acetyltransferase